MIKIDNLVAREEHLFPTPYTFCGLPIKGLDQEAANVDLIKLETRRLVKYSSGKSIPAEVLPGEMICADGIIRRGTTAEAVGYDTYHNQEYTEKDAKRVSIGVARLAATDGKLILWRPNCATGKGAYALVYEEEQCVDFASTKMQLN